MRRPGDQVEVAADRIRDELLGTLRELDRRRVQATDIGFQARQHAGLLTAIGGGAALAVGAVVGASLLRRRSQRKQRFRRRFEAVRRSWDYPERLATRTKDQPAPRAVVRKLAVALLIALGSQVAKRAAQALVRPSPREPREALH